MIFHIIQPCDCEKGFRTPILYSGLFSLGANFLEFHKWAHYLGKFILSCYMKFDCGSLLQKLAQTQLSYKHLPKAMGCKVLQSTIAAEVT